ncbi:MAG: acetyl-CoA carboxylase biotin carboxyl carrier protein subunit [Bacteroidales bacterium]|jgi:biotin carboxyl carrier protein|nr:acetyl-CoA carboxylase biotin carboxyl carrier protein subunit [Bacteroidales bacterium]
MKSYKFKINGTSYSVNINNVEKQSVELELNGTPYVVELDKEVRQTKTPKLVRSVAVPSTDSTPQTAKTSSFGSSAIKSPLPGTVLDVFVNVGDKVSLGQKVMLLEAMKMENVIESDQNGVVKEIQARKGDSVMEGSVLVIIGD